MKIKRSLNLILLVVCHSFCLFLNAEKLGVLEDPFKAPFIRMDDNQIYIYDNVFLEFHLYSKKTLKKISEFGSKGEGPGEFRAINHVKINNQNICVSNFPKVSIFSKVGRLIKELKAPTNVSYFIPTGDNFVGVQNSIDRNNKEKDSLIFSLFNSSLNKKQTLYKGEFAKFVKFKKCKLISRWFRDCTRAITYKDKIIIGSTDRGFFFTVFDSEGNRLYDINRSYKKRKVTDNDKKERIKKAKEVLGEQKWKKFIIGTEISFPEYFPAYMNFEVDGGKIYAFAFPEKDKQEILILDLKGKLIKQINIPPIDLPGYIEHSCFCINKDKMYYMKENEEIQKWEIHYNILE